MSLCLASHLNPAFTFDIKPMTFYSWCSFQIYNKIFIFFVPKDVCDSAQGPDWLLISTANDAASSSIVQLHVLCSPCSWVVCCCLLTASIYVSWFLHCVPTSATSSSIAGLPSTWMHIESFRVKERHKHLAIIIGFDAIAYLQLWRRIGLKNTFSTIYLMAKHIHTTQAFCWVIDVTQSMVGFFLKNAIIASCVNAWDYFFV